MTFEDTAIETDIAAAVRAVVNAGATEAGRFSDEIIGFGPLPGTPEWEAEQSTTVPAERALAWHLLSLRIQLAAGLDGIETVIVLRTQGATWAIIGRATGISRQSAHERWGARVTAILDPMETGMPTLVAKDNPL
ncbi:hypothetical protein QMK17_13375 [Rhodococcus sp. G-MC3]|uniref:hypothetical protein n=1 Tax=Rhodococcus sp. G-MC3 TaxID=3046209 RepID=UPI0024BB29C3|nr:hypothetical protein [Rhodococcus sp. G-MC3]MDJ0394318.1 hypothetical protein [Rhodococcus sp. G-MC3]